VAIAVPFDDDSWELYDRVTPRAPISRPMHTNQHCVGAENPGAFPRTPGSRKNSEAMARALHRQHAHFSGQLRLTIWDQGAEASDLYIPRRYWRAGLPTPDFDFDDDSLNRIQLRRDDGNSTTVLDVGRGHRRSTMWRAAESRSNHAGYSLWRLARKTRALTLFVMGRAYDTPPRQAADALHGPKTCDSKANQCDDSALCRARNRRPVRNSNRSKRYHATL